MLGSDPSDKRGALSYSLASDIVELVILTTDDVFLQTLREAVGASRRLWHVPSADKVSDLLLAGQVGILVLDVAALNETASVFVAQIKRQFPDLVVIVAGNREAEMSLAGLISAGVVYRFIHKPMSPGRAKLFADAAVKKYAERRMLVSKTPAASAAFPRKQQLLVIGAVAVLATLVAVTWALRGGSRHAEAGSAGAANQPAAVGPAATGPTATSPTAAGPPPVAGAAAPAGENAPEVYTSPLARAREQLQTATADRRAKGDARAPDAKPGEDLLARSLRLAAQRMQEGHLIDPDHDNARYYVQEAVRLDHDGNGAQAAEQMLAIALVTEARGAIQRRDFPHAVGLLDAANGIASPSTIESLLQQLRNARKEADTDASTQLLKAGQERLRDDRLIEPANDNAKYYLLTLRGLDPDNAGLAPALTDLGSRLVAKARRALAVQQFDAARHWLDAAADIGTGSAELTEVSRELEAATLRNDFLSNVVGANQLTLVKSVKATYPRKAEQNATEGWVELEFTVEESGAVKDIAVIRAAPAGVFDAAAIGALAQWRYAPVLHDGKPAAQRARIRIRFTLGG